MDCIEYCIDFDNSVCRRSNCIEANKSNMGDGFSKCSNDKQHLKFSYSNRANVDDDCSCGFAFSVHLHNKGV